MLLFGCQNNGPAWPWQRRSSDVKRHGRDGNDILFGQNGADTLWGDADADLLYGGKGKDDLNGGSGKNTVNSGNGSVSDDELKIIFENPMLVMLGGDVIDAVDRRTPTANFG